MKQATLTHLQRYYELIYQLLYPISEKSYRLSAKNLQSLLKQVKNSPSLYNSGLPGTQQFAQFSLEFTNWYINQHAVPTFQLKCFCKKEFLQRMLFPFLTKTQQEFLTEAHLNWKEWCYYLNYSPELDTSTLKTIIHLIGNSQHTTEIKELIFQQLQVFLEAEIPFPAPPSFLIQTTHYYPEGPEKKCNLASEITSNAPQFIKLSLSEKETIVTQAKLNLLGLCRETDPITFCDTAKTNCITFMDGTVINLFYLNKAKSLKHQQYVGYLLYRNNLPLAYGGGWIYQKQIRFGMNILPYGRGGESTKILARLISTYKMLYKPDVFVMDNYQIGYHNPEAIETGAFWFYYKLGFRSMKESLNLLAQKEQLIKQKNPAYRTPVRVLKKLSEVPVYLEFKQGAAKKYMDAKELKE